MKLQLLVIFFLSITNLNGQSVGQKLTEYLTLFQTEKVYLNHNKPFYAPGETIWCKLYLVDGSTHQTYQATPVVYVDWIAPDGSTKQHFTLQINEGTASLDITTLPSDTTGIYTLRAYSQYQKNFDDHYLFQKEIRLLDQSVGKAPPAAPIESFGLEFFPEGGHLVNGMESTVAFKAMDENGKNISVSGVLVNAAGEKVSDFLTLNEGMGMIKFRPTAGEQYTVKGRYKGTEIKFPLPPALPKGFVLKATSRSAEQIKVTISTNFITGLAGASLVGHVRGQLFLEEELTDKTDHSLLLAKADLPSGLLHFTLFDAQQRPVAERLVFNKNPKEVIDLNLATDGLYDKRKRVSLTISSAELTTDQSANLSLSVYNAEAMETGLSSLSIENYLLLQSELKGRINNIQQYFEQDDAKTNTLLDLLLLTHGWRKFNWQDVLSNTPPDLPFPREEHLSIAGKITKIDRPKTVMADVQLNVLDPGYFTAAEVTTAEDGIFHFKGFDFKDTVDVLLQASTHNARQKEKMGEEEFGRTGSRYVDINILDLNEYPLNSEVTFSSNIYQPEAMKRYAFTTANEIMSNGDGLSAFTVNLDEITVTTGLSPGQRREKKIKKRYDEKGLFYFGTTQKFLTDDPMYDGFVKRDVFDLISVVVPRAYLARKKGRKTVVFGSPVNGTEPVIVLDGEVIDTHRLGIIRPDEIAVVDVLEGLLAQLYSSKGMVIALVSKNPGEVKRPNPGIINIRHPGFYQARTFYSPDYALLGEAAEGGADYRTTLFWKPDIKLESQAKTIEFYTGDKPGSYLIMVEGLRSDGVPFVGKSSFTVR